MFKLTFERLKPIVAEKIKPFAEEVLGKCHDNIHSIHITGTAVTEDFNAKRSDINSIFVLKEMDLKFLELLALLGKKYSREKIAAPLIMTPEYIKRSVDVFPIEFLNFKLIHVAVFGDDIFREVEINKTDLREQCERELKVKLLWLRQDYISHLGNLKNLAEGFVSSISGYIPLFRSIITLLGKEPPASQFGTITVLSEAANINTGVFAKVLRRKRGEIKFAKEDIETLFADYYAALERLGNMVDEIK